MRCLAAPTCSENGGRSRLTPPSAKALRLTGRGFSATGFSCRLRVPLNTIQPNRYDRLSACYGPSASLAEKEAAVGAISSRAVGQ